MKNKIIVILVCTSFFVTLFSTLGASSEYPLKLVVNGIYKNYESELINSNDDEITLIGGLDFIEVIDQKQTSSSDQGCPFFSFLWVAQGFIPTLETLTKVEVKLFKGGNPTSPIIISIRDSLSGNDLTSVSVDGSLVSEYSKWIEFNFPDISVTPGNEYYIVCRSSGGSMINYYCAVFDIYNPYAGGEAWGSINYGANWELIEEYYPEYPEPDACFITYGLDEPPSSPIISGETNGNIGTEYAYSFSATDSEGHDLYYYVKWADDTTSGWIGEYTSGETVSLNHVWEAQGTYAIEVKAKDIYGAEGDWGELVVTMPKNKAFNFNLRLLSWLFEEFPNAFPIFRYLVGV